MGFYASTQPNRAGAAHQQNLDGGASTVIRNTYSLTPLIVKIPSCLTLRKGKEFPKPD